MFDVAIVGAGPAGATLARLIDSRYRVLVADSRPFGVGDAAGAGRPGQVKCCGGLLAPDAQKAIGEMGLGLPQSVLVSPQLFIVRAMDLATGLERYYQRFYLNMDRERFDCWLLSLLPATVDLRVGTRVAALRQADDGYELELAGSRGSYRERARIVVGADGANSLIRRSAFGRPKLRAYAAIQEWHAADGPLPYYTAIFDRSVTDFYAWTIPKDGCLVFGAALPLTGPRERFAALKRRLHAHGLELVGEPIRREGCLVLRPRGSRDLTLGRGGIALIGEAAGWISPSSAEGLSFAFRSARALAGALATGLAGCVDRYVRSSRGLALELDGKHLKSLVMYQPQLRGMILRSGIASAAGGGGAVAPPLSAPDA